jgi:hypothetical protein
MSDVEAPLEDKNWNFGKMVLMGSNVKSIGALWMMDCIWSLEKQWVLKKAITESGFLGVLKWNRFDALRAFCGDKPQVLVRYETVKDCWSESEVVVENGLRKWVGWRR